MVAKRKGSTKTKKTATTKKVEEVKKPKQSPKNIELDSETKSAIIEEVAKAMRAEIEGKVQVAIQQILKAGESRKDTISLVGGPENYLISADEQGLGFVKDGSTVLNIGRGQQLSTNTKSPRSVGKGSMHIKAGYPSESIIPTNGKGSTIGLIVEGEGDDENTFVFKAGSRMNRQGTNIHSDGSLSIASMTKVNDATLGIYHRFQDKNALSIKAPTKNLEEASLLHLDTSSAIGGNYNLISAEVETGEDSSKTEIFKVDSNGSILTDKSFYSNYTGYAELFQWDDNNPRDEDRTGFTVAVTSEGKLKVADDEDVVIGVVVKNCAVVGNSMWNVWKNKFKKDSFGTVKNKEYTITEWLENETTILKSFYTAGLVEDFALPENAVEYQTDMFGKDLKRNVINAPHFKDKEYESRLNRQEWTQVMLVGTTPVFKGQHTNKNWIVLKDLNDELELMLIK